MCYYNRPLFLAFLAELLVDLLHKLIIMNKNKKSQDDNMNEDNDYAK